MTTVLTPEKLKEKFELEGKTFSGWAEERNYTRQEVYRVVNGFTKAKRGKAHRIAVELGLKAQVIEANLGQPA